VEGVEVCPVDLPSGARGPAQSMIELIPTALPVSVDHVVRVTVR
jgi:hypothetical protein